MLRSLLTILLAGATVGAKPVITPGGKELPVPGEAFRMDGHEAFVIRPAAPEAGQPWIWYAPTLPGLPGEVEKWMFERFLEAGMAVAGIDVGESYGSPGGRNIYDTFYEYLVGERDFAARPVLLARSRGGLMLYNWAVENPESVAGVAGIYPVCDLASYPGVERAAAAYEMGAGELEEKLREHNPIERLKPLAEAGVPIFHLHGDRDEVVPLERNSAELAKRYREFEGSVELAVMEGRGHDMWDGWFQSEKLARFAIERAKAGSPRAELPGIKAGARVTLKGRLMGGIVAIGGETTGWKLEYERDGTRGSIEVDMSAVKDAGSFEGKMVTITGTIVSKQYVERGAVLILRAQELR